MVTIEINIEAPGAEEMAMVLEMIAKHLREGYTSGHVGDGSWLLDDDNEVPEQMSTEAEMDDDSDMDKED
jgi:hypothetical protein